MSHDFSPHRRLRLASHAADRPTGARGGRLLRNPSVLESERSVRAAEAKAVILSGGPASVPEAGSPRAPAEVFASGVPILAICYGQQTLCEQLGGKVEGGHAAEFGRADVEILESCALFDGVWRTGGRYPVWMSHGDRVTRLPEGFRVYAVSENAPYAVAADETRRYYTTMFHPEVAHTPDGAKLLANFLFKIAKRQRRLDDGRLPRRGDRPHSRASRQVARDLRLVGRRQFGGRGRAHPRGDRRPAHLRVRRPRAHAPRRSGRSGESVPRPFQHSARSRRRRAKSSSRRSQASTTPRPSARRSAGCSSTHSRPRRAASPATAKDRSTFWRKARSIPT